MELRAIGYWRSARHPDYPDPHDLVDESWDRGERFVVQTYLDGGTFVRGYMDPSPCRICGQSNGVSEYTDGVLVWPEGLAHYVRDHAVRLPAAIEEYVLRRVTRLAHATTTADWWAAGTAR